MRVDVIAPPVLGGLRAVHVPAADWEELRACPVCDRSQHLVDLGIVEGTEPGAITSACLDCEHGFLRRRPTAAWLEGFYASDWDARGRRRAGAGSARGRPQTKVLELAAPHLPSGARVVDVGAGFGDQLLGFREHGHEPYAIEPSDHRATALQELGIRWLGPSITTSDLPFQPDLVFSNHVLEHVPDPAEVLRATAQALPPGGLAYVAVPNLWHEHPPQAFHFVPHLSLFSERSLTRLLAGVGLSVVDLRVDRELQLLARREPAANGAAGHAGAGTAFAERIAAWAIEPWGPGPGRSLIAWRKARKTEERFYEPYVASPGGLGERVRRSLSRSVSGWDDLPSAFARDRTLRALRIDRDESTELPVTVRHQAPAEAVWIK